MSGAQRWPPRRLPWTRKRTSCFDDTDAPVRPSVTWFVGSFAPLRESQTWRATGATWRRAFGGRSSEFDVTHVGEIGNGDAESQMRGGRGECPGCGLLFRSSSRRPRSRRARERMGVATGTSDGPCASSGGVSASGIPAGRPLPRADSHPGPPPTGTSSRRGGGPRSGTARR